MGVKRIGKRVIEGVLEKMPASRPIALGGVTLKGVKKVINSDDVGRATGTVSLTAADSGTVFLLDGDAATTFNLPTPQAGIEYMFISVDAGSANNVIKATTDGSTAEDIMTGLLFNNNDAPLITNSGNSISTITFVGSTSTTGDFCRIIGIGTGTTDGNESWWCEVYCDANGGVTVAAED